MAPSFLTKGGYLDEMVTLRCQCTETHGVECYFSDLFLMCRVPVVPAKYSQMCACTYRATCISWRAYIASLVLQCWKSCCFAALWHHLSLSRGQIPLHASWAVFLRASYLAQDAYSYHFQNQTSSLIKAFNEDPTWHFVLGETPNSLQNLLGLPHISL